MDDAALFTKAEIQSISARTDASAVIFSLTSPDGDQGYSGTLYLETLVALLQPVKLEPSTASQHELGSIVIVYRAKLVDLPEGQKKVTPINLTQVRVVDSELEFAHIFTVRQHWGFNLDASLQEGEKTLKVLDHDLTIKVSHI